VRIVFTLSLRERVGVRGEYRKTALILERLFPTRSTASVSGGVSFSQREKGTNGCGSAHYLPFSSVTLLSARGRGKRGI